MPQDDASSEALSGRIVSGGFSPLFAEAPLPVIEVEGPDHRVRSVNEAFCTLCGRARGELVGRSFASLFGDSQRCIEQLDQAYHAVHAEMPTLAWAPPAVSWLVVQWQAVVPGAPAVPVLILLSAARAHLEVAASLNEALLLSGLRQHELREAAEKSNVDLQAEIAERQRAECELLAAQGQLRANAADLELIVAERTAQLRTSVGELEAFAYSLAHDLRAPVRAIHGFTQAVLDMPAGQVAPPAVDLLKRVVSAAIRMDSLIRDVLALNQVIRRPISLVPVELAPLLRSLMQERPELAAHLGEIQVEQPLPAVLAHEAMLGQCLSALLLNAVKFVAPGKLPRVRVWAEACPEEESLLPVAGTRIWVEDEGIGIPLTAQERIFEMFERLHSPSQYEGAGIGLAIVRKAVARMGGAVGVRSDGVKGSRFWLELPRA